MQSDFDDDISDDINYFVICNITMYETYVWEKIFIRSYNERSS